MQQRAAAATPSSGAATKVETNPPPDGPGTPGQRAAEMKCREPETCRHAGPHPRDGGFGIGHVRDVRIARLELAQAREDLPGHHGGAWGRRQQLPVVVDHFPKPVESPRMKK